ncbi:DUF624 domain-containing protein [Actinopolymorpha sp. B17G11]|uniref:DUF624 domain-containing protein n=1 Tax=Actinopolymorpha sp. B17G11 TaxID=3160861 RepID=UPI0032E515E6
MDEPEEGGAGVRIDSQLYRALSGLTELAWLSVLWLVASLPVVTAPAATAAMFRLAGLRADGGTGRTSWRFLASFGADFGRSTRTGGAWLLAGVVLVADFRALDQVPDPARIPLTGVLVAALVAYAAATPYLFCLLAAGRTSGPAAVRLAVLTMAANPAQTARILVVEAACLSAVVVVWPLLAIVPAVGAVALHRLCEAPLSRSFGLVTRTGAP